MKYLLWDIDGTLLLTNYAGLAALKETLAMRYGRENFSFTYGLEGRTDLFIARQAIRDIKGTCTDCEALALLEQYTQLLPAHLVTHKGYLMPHVRETLNFLAKRSSDYTSLLLTGNCTAAAKAKVKYYGLEWFFDYNLSAFGELSEERSDLAAACLEHIRTQDPKVNPSDLIVLGDTPHDIACAKSIGATSIAIMSGSRYSVADMERCAPTYLLPELPEEPLELLSLIQEAYT